MLVQILKSKIHRVRITEADVDYEGSIVLDGEFMEKSGIIPYEMVHIWDITSGDRLYTYVLPPAPKGSGIAAINGAAALRIKKGHLVIITSFVNLTEEQVKTHKPKVLIMDENNKIKQIIHE